jgi:hypothetical protein
MTVDELLVLLRDEEPHDPEGVRAVLSDILCAALDFHNTAGVCHVALHIAVHAIEAKGLYDEAATQEILSYQTEIADFLLDDDEGLSAQTRARLKAIRNTRAEAK